MRLAYPAMLGFFLLAHQAAAQGAPQEWVLKLTPDQVTYLGKLLGQRPYDEVSQLVTSINQQMTAQMADAKKAAAEAEQKRIDDAVKAATKPDGLPAGGG